MERKLASIRKISSIAPINGADMIELAHIDGWQTIVKKDSYKEGDKIVYCEIDSFLPVREEFEFLRKNCFKSTTHLGDGFRIKTVKLRGTLSQGIIFPLSILPSNYVCLEGDDVTSIIGVQKYEKPIPAQLSGKIKGNFPIFVRKTDQERIQNISNELDHRLEEQFEVTIKLDGSSMTVYHNNGQVGVCSRNLDLKIDDENKDNSFVKTAIETNLITMVQKYFEKYNTNIAIQGELMGPGIQGNREKLKTTEFFLFDVWNIDAQEYEKPDIRNLIVDRLKEWGPNLKTVPFVERTNLTKFKENIVDNILQYADGPSLNSSIIREGVVFRSINHNYSFKAINNRYLLENE